MNRSDFEGKIRRGKYTGPGWAIWKADSPVPRADATAGAVTMLASDVYAGFYIRNAASANVTTPTAAQLVAGLPGVAVGDMVSMWVTNGTTGAADSALVTIVPGTGVTIDSNITAASQIVRTGSSRLLSFRFTNVTPGSEAVVLYM